jgi:hypothetical protein
MKKKQKEKGFIIGAYKDYKGGENGRYNKYRNPGGNASDKALSGNRTF